MKDNPNRIGIGKFWSWQARGTSGSSNFIIMSYLMLFATTTMGMPVALVGTLLMASRIVNAFFAIPAGLLIDRTQTRFGKARPYEFAILGLWFFTWLLFSMPGEASLTIQAIWLVAFQTLASSVCGTLTNAGNSVYLMRAFPTDEQKIRLTSFGGFVGMSVSIIISISFPILVSNFATTPQGWSNLVLMFAIPMSILGMLRFFFVKETVKIEGETTEQAKVRDIWRVLKDNKYLRVLVVLSFVSAVFTSMGVGQFFFMWVMGDIALMGVMGTLSIVVLPSMLFFPRLLKKFSKGNLVVVGSVFYIIGGIILFSGGSDITMPIVMIAGAFNAIGVLPTVMLADLLILDVGSYNVYKSGKRMDGTLSSIRNFLALIGGALGPGLLGVMLGLSGFDGTLTAQPNSAIFTIRVAMGIVPAALFAIVAAVFVVFWKLEKEMPKIKSQLEKQLIENKEEDCHAP